MKAYNKQEVDSIFSSWKDDLDQLDVIEVVHSSVLDKIKAEIDQKQYDFMADGDYNEGVRFGLMLTYQIIDKCKKEGEGKE